MKYQEYSLSYRCYVDNHVRNTKRSYFYPLLSQVTQPNILRLNSAAISRQTSHVTAKSPVLPSVLSAAGVDCTIKQHCAAPRVDRARAPTGRSVCHCQAVREPQYKVIDLCPLSQVFRWLT